MGMSPQEFLGGGGGMEASDNPEDPKMLLGVDPKRDAPMARTLRDINNGVPAPELRWSGPLVNSETGQQDTDSRFVAAKPAEAPKAMSPEEFLGRKPVTSDDSLTSKTLSIAKQTASNLAGFADMILSVPGMVLGTGADIGTRINEFVDPLLRGYEAAPRKEQGRRALEAGQQISAPFMNPLHKLMVALGYGKDYETSDVSAAMGALSKAIEKGGDQVEKLTKGLLTSEDAQSLANSVMAGLGAWGTNKAVQPRIDAIGKAKPGDIPGSATTAEAAKRLREQDYNSPQEFTADLERAAQAESLSAIDKARNAEKQAYDLMQSGASKKQVEAIRKQNPAVGEALDRMMERRNLAIEGFSDTYQGEVIPADQYVPYFRFDNINRPDAPPIKQLGTPTLRLTGPDAPALEDLSGRFAAEGAARDAAQAAAEAATRQPTGRGTLFQQRMPDGRLEPVDTGMRGATPDTLQNFSTDLQRAAQKQAAGQGFAMTAEERIAWNKATWAKEHLQGGKADPRLLALIAATGLTVAGFLALDPKDREDAKVLGLAAAMLPVGGGLSSLSTALRKAGNYSSTILERLPQDRHTFTKKQVWEQVVRSDVSQAEKDAFKYILRNQKGQQITAQELVDGFYQDTADLRLGRTEYQEEPAKDGTRQLAEWGLDRIDRQALDEHGEPQPVPSATSTIYQLPYKVATNNHFGDYQYYGHTRSFIDELGERRVVEVQSDLLQKLRPLTKAEETQILHELDRIRGERVAINKAHNSLMENPRPQVDTAALEAQLPASLLDEFRQRTGSAPGALQPHTAFHVLDELREERTLRKLELTTRLRAPRPEEVERLGPISKYWPQRLIREELARAAQDGQKTEHFATADTVAMVEGWPGYFKEDVNALTADIANIQRDLPVYRNPSAARAAALTDLAKLTEALKGLKEGNAFFHDKGHQSIYDRYRKDIEPYLKKLGGVETKDSAGHTWISVPVKPEHGRVPTFGQAGQIDPRLLARMAAVGLGVTLGMWASDRDHKWAGAALGAMVGLGLGRSPAKLVQTWKGLWAKDTRFRIDDLTNAWEFAQDKAAKLAWDLQRSVEKLVPEEAGRKRITAWLDGDRTVQLTGAEQRAATMVRAWFDGMKQAATKAGVLKTSLDDYVTHLWDWKIGKAQSPIVQAYLDRLEGQGTGMGTSSPYAKKRSFSTLEEGKRNGLTPLTEDISAIVGIYSNSMSRAMANKGLLEGLKQGKMPNGMELVIPSAKAPHYYKYINAPQLAGVMVHPDIAPSLEFLFSQAPRGVIPAVLEMLNTAIKRVQLSFSLFHVKALTDAGIAGTSHPLRFLKKLPQYALGTTELLQQLRQQGVAPLIDLAYKCGLKFGLEKGKLVVEDVGMDSFYAGMKSLEKGLDGVFQGLGKPIKGLAEVNHEFDKFMWDRVHTGMKLDMFAEKVEVLLKSSVKRHAKDSSIPVLTREQAGVIAASFTNDLFGGLNWRRIAEQAHTTWGRNLALQVYAKQGRWWMQLAIFAPDWTLSTTRAMVKAFGKGSGPRGLIDPITLADLHRQYIARAAAIYFTVGNILNQALSGKWLWENEDWTSIDRGDGRWLQWSKHTMEPVHWMQKPGQQGLNKFGILPKEALEQVLDVEYLSTKGNMRPMEGDRVAHAAKKLLPISVGQSFEAGAENGLMGFAGMPVYGRSDTQRANDRLKRRLERLDRLGEDRGK